MSVDLPPWFTDTFGAHRIAPYQEAARRDGIRTLDLVLWNIQATEAFHTPLGMLETSFRHAVHERLKSQYQRPDWWAAAPLSQHDLTKVTKATGDAQRERNQPTADDIAAQLTFGFWINLLSQRHDRHFWVPVLHQAFPGHRGRRRDLHDNLEAMCYLRNRVAHHEPIHHRDLAADHAKIYRLINYVRPDLTTWLRGFDRVPAVLANRPGRGHSAI
ncbi:MAG: hypothetical protein JWM19_7063 [Actinomycetia bacterium]|nr:hypothetical protein [Actinomycetes bacterium]